MGTLGRAQAKKCHRLPILRITGSGSALISSIWDRNVFPKVSRRSWLHAGHFPRRCSLYFRHLRPSGCPLDCGDSHFLRRIGRLPANDRRGNSTTTTKRGWIQNLVNHSIYLWYPVYVYSCTVGRHCRHHVYFSTSTTVNGVSVPLRGCRPTIACAGVCILPRVVIVDS